MSGLTNESRENSYKKKVEDDISECSKNLALKTMTSILVNYLQKPRLCANRPDHGFDGQTKWSEIAVFVWESDGK